MSSAGSNGFATTWGPIAMDDLLIRLRIQVERATEPIDPSEVRTHRRPRPRVLTVAVVAAAFVAVVGALSIRAATHETTPSTIARGSGPDQRGISLERVDVHTGPDGTQEITFVFDGPLPDHQLACGSRPTRRSSSSRLATTPRSTQGSQSATSATLARSWRAGPTTGTSSTPSGDPRPTTRTMSDSRSRTTRTE
jgi:hypothetical protein